MQDFHEFKNVVVGDARANAPLEVTQAHAECRVLLHVVRPCGIQHKRREARGYDMFRPTTQVWPLIQDSSDVCHRYVRFGAVT